MSDSLALDQQAAADAMFSILVAQLTGTHLAHDVGYLEAGLMTSPEMIMLCAELIAEVRRFSSGFSLDGEQLALDVIDAVGPGGSFIAEEHTLRHFRETWQPSLFGHYRMADWLRHGGKTLDARLQARTLAKIESHRSAPPQGRVLAEVQNVLGESVMEQVLR
jgi:trimethylamine--corrinoid protein Co-methyltransferase